MTRIAMLCDTAGLWWAAIRFNNGRVDYTKLRRQASEQGSLVSCVAMLTGQADGIGRFERALKYMGYETVLAPDVHGVDKLIHAAAIEAAKHCDVVVIAASSGNYMELQNELRTLGVKLEIWAFPIACPLDEMNGKADVWTALGDAVIQAA